MSPVAADCASADRAPAEAPCPCLVVPPQATIPRAAARRTIGTVLDMTPWSEPLPDSLLKGLRRPAARLAILHVDGTPCPTRGGRCGAPGSAEPGVARGGLRGDGRGDWPRAARVRLGRRAGGAGGRHRAAGLGRPRRLPGAARSGREHAGALPDRTRRPYRPPGRLPGGRGRLRHEAVRPGRGSGAVASPAPE